MEKIENVQNNMARREERKLRQKQLEAKKRQMARESDERDVMREEYYNKLMGREEALCKRSWKAIDLAEKEKRDAIARKEAEVARKQVILVKEKARALNLDLRTPGLFGTDRIEAIEKRIAKHHEQEIIVRDAINRRFARMDEQPKIRSKIRAFGKRSHDERMVIAVGKRQCSDFLKAIQLGANPNAESKNGLTPIIAAVYEGHLHLIRELVDNK